MEQVESESVVSGDEQPVERLSDVHEDDSSLLESLLHEEDATEKFLLAFICF